MRLFAIVISAALLLSGCASVQKDWAATGGSRADGVVRLSYEIGEFENVQVNEQQAISLAAQRCSTWGYTGAEAFGGVTRQCSETSALSGSCGRWMITKEYQCTGPIESINKS
ncbi:YecR family lipoprotein [Aeromonas caviae]|uniref:YecR family lipoprotein n=1 Tax=Aeromonas caviae TaxID=648 RepID=UPI003989ACAF